MRQVRRRQFLIGTIGLVTLSLSAHAQTERRVRQIGYLSQSSAQVNAARLAAFRAGMMELRWVEGRDYFIDARYANGVTHALPGLAADLVATRPDLLLVPSDEDVRLLAQRTKTIPIVFAMTQDPVGNGLVASLRRPGGNATGLTSLATELSAKRLQLLKEAFPRVAHVVLLFEPDNVGSVSQAKEIEEVARAPGDARHPDRAEATRGYRAGFQASRCTRRPGLYRDYRRYHRQSTSSDCRSHYSPQGSGDVCQ